MDKRFRITPPDPPNDGILFADLQKSGRSGHMGHALVEYAPGKVLAFYPNCSAEDARWKGHSGYGWMEYKRSQDGGETWSEPLIEPHSKALYDRQAGRTQMCEKALCLPDGRILLFYLTCDMTVNGHIWEPYHEPYYAYSSDGGETFTAQKMLIDRRGRVYDARIRDGIVYVLFFANPELPGYDQHAAEHPLLLLVSEDLGESFAVRSEVGFQSMANTYYGTMCFRSDGSLIVYAYDEKDENNLKYTVSADGGHTWQNNRRAYFEKRMRNPQIAYFQGAYFMHGRSGSGGEHAGSFILYASEDGVCWDQGTYLRLREAGAGAYSNNALTHAPDGRERLLIQTSHAYRENRTNTIQFWVDA